MKEKLSKHPLEQEVKEYIDKNYPVSKKNLKTVLKQMQFSPTLSSISNKIEVDHWYVQARHWAVHEGTSSKLPDWDVPTILGAIRKFEELVGFKHDFRRDLRMLIIGELTNANKDANATDFNGGNISDVNIKRYQKLVNFYNKLNPSK